MRRKLLIFLSALSLLSCVVVSVPWLKSHWMNEHVLLHTHRTTLSPACWVLSGDYSAQSFYGVVRVERETRDARPSLKQSPELTPGLNWRHNAKSSAFRYDGASLYDNAIGCRWRSNPQRA